MEILNTCLKKAFYLLERNLKQESENDAFTFGRAIHKGLELWYTSPVSERIYKQTMKERAEMIGFGQYSDTVFDELYYKVIQEFTKIMEPLKHLDNDKRSIQNGIKILTDYFKKYETDDFEIAKLNNKPCVELDFSFPLAEIEHENYKVEIEYFGRIDCIMKCISTQNLMVFDHKTTSKLGGSFINRHKPNHQYTGYMMGAASLGLPVKGFVINGIQVAKTKTEFLRQVTIRDESDFGEFKEMVVETVYRYLRAKKLDRWYMNAPSPCTAYNGCQYIDICQLPATLRETAIKNKYDL